MDVETADARTARAIGLSQKGLLAQAEEMFREILQSDSFSASAHHNLAVCLIQRGRAQEAHVHLAEAVRLDPGYAQAHRSLGGFLHSEGRYAEAESHLRCAIAIDPRDAEAMNNLGVVLNSTSRFEEASVILRQAIRLQPDLADACNNLGISLTSLGRLSEARRWLDRALELRPDYAAAHSNLGNAYKEEQRLPEALASYDLALALTPDSVSTHWNRSLALLQKGDFEHGWEEYEWRWKRPQTPPRPFPQPRWQGESLAGRTIVLYAEQGLGDTIQFIRYARLLKAQGAAVLFECPSPLVSSLKGCEALDGIFSEGTPLPSFDVHAPLMSLPWILKTKLENVPCDVPYILVDPALESGWKARLAERDGSGRFRVGIAWRGNPHHGWDRFRSIRLVEFERLGPLSRVEFFSLQTGPGTEQLQHAGRPGGRLPVTALLRETAGGPDWADIAAFMKNLDLVITVDTATAHLAGALGIPVWILIAAISDWRWLVNRHDSPWYPTARLYRQENLGSWARVFRRIREDLMVL